MTDFFFQRMRKMQSRNPNFVQHNTVKFFFFQNKILRKPRYVLLHKLQKFAVVLQKLDFATLVFAFYGYNQNFEDLRIRKKFKFMQKDSVIHWFNDHNSKTKPFMTRCCLATVHYYMYNKKQNENKDKKRWEKIFEVFNICLNLKSEVKLYLYSFSVRFQIISEWLTIVRVPSYLF